MGKVIVKHNSTYAKGKYGLSVGHQPGGGANIEQLGSDAELRKRLLDLGLTEAASDEIIASLKNRGDSKTIDVDLTCRIEGPPDVTQVRCKTHNQVLGRESFGGVAMNSGPLDQFVCPIGGGIALYPRAPK